MSTKTSFKRIAAVAAVALTLGGFSAVSANASSMLADSLLNAADGSSVVASSFQVGSSTPATAKIVYSSVASDSAGTASVTGTILSVPATSGAYAVSFAATGGTSPDSTSPAGSITAAGVITTTGAGRVTKYITASFTPDVAGTYVIALKAAGGANNSTVTWTVTASAIPAATAAASSVGFSTGANDIDVSGALNYRINTGGATAAAAIAAWNVSGAATANADGSFSIPVTAGSAGANVGGGLVSFSNSLTSNTAVAVPMTVAISGHGYVRVVDFTAGNSSYGTSVTQTDSVGYTPFGAFGKVKGFQVMSDGTSGPATVTVSAGGVTLGTVKLNFTGSRASLALATGTSTKLSKNYIGSGDTATVSIQGFDANSNLLSSSGITAVTSSDATGLMGAAGIVGDVVTVTGGSVQGKVTWTVTDGTRTVTFVTNTVKKTAKSVVISASNTTPAPGEKVTLTITATDANGSPVADGNRDLFSSTGLTTNFAVTGNTCVTGATVALVGGVATCSFYAPATPGALTISASEGAATDNVVAGGTAAAITTTVTVGNAALDAAQAAQDAANEATDAANAATDAANNAMDSADAAQQAALDAGDKADAALAAITDLATKVSDIATQVSALSALVAKIAAAVAKISAKVKA